MVCVSICIVPGKQMVSVIDEVPDITEVAVSGTQRRIRLIRDHQISGKHGRLWYWVQLYKNLGGCGHGGLRC